VGEYIPTTSTINSAPRFDHNPVTGESLGLLVEEARTNLLLQSGWAGAATGTPGAAPTSWTTEFGTNTETTLVPSVFGSADGAQAIKFNADSGERIMFRQTINVTSGTTYVLSVYVESITGSIGRVLTVVAGTATRTIVSGDVDRTTPGRAVLVFTADSTGTVNIRAGVGTTNTVGATVEATLSRPQLEAGAFPTSYIPTTTATVTRSADVASISGSNFSSWYRQDEGTAFARCSGGSLTNNGVSFDANDGTTSNRHVCNWSTSRITTSVLNVTQSDLNLADPSAANVVTQTAFAFKANDFGASFNGEAAVVDASGTVPTVDRLTIGDDANGGNILNGTIRRLTYWPTRLPNSTLQAVTQ
jgi:hypothetical protein